jgi:hypothetical protein
VARVELDERPLAAYAQLEKASANVMLDAIDDAVDLLESGSASAAARRRSFGDGLWGIPVKDRSDDWLIIWETADLARTASHSADMQANWCNRFDVPRGRFLTCSESVARRVPT